MPQFRILPRNPDLPSTRVVALDASMVLNIIERMNCSEADVECEGRYAFSACLYDNGLWSIYHRQPAAARGVPLPQTEPVACLTTA